MNASRHASVWALVVALATLTIDARGATIWSRDAEDPSFVGEASRCEDFPAVSTEGWRAVRDPAVGTQFLLPRAFTLAPPAGDARRGHRWTDGERIVEIADDDLSDDVQYSRCKASLASGDVLVLRAPVSGGVHLMVWPLSPRDEFGVRDSTIPIVGRGWEAADEAQFLAVAASYLGNYRARPIERLDGQQGTADVRLLLDVSPGPVPIRDGAWQMGRVLVARLENHGSAAATHVRPAHVTCEVRRNGRRIPAPRSQLPHLDVIESPSVFELGPGEGRLLSESSGDPEIKQPGRYRVRMRYVSDPTSLASAGTALRDESTAERIRNSTRCDLSSNWVEIEIPGPTLRQ